MTWDFMFYSKVFAVMGLSIGTPKNNKFSGKLIVFKCQNIWVNYSLTIIGLNIGTPKKH